MDDHAGERACMVCGVVVELGAEELGAEEDSHQVSDDDAAESLADATFDTVSQPTESVQADKPAERKSLRSPDDVCTTLLLESERR